MRFFLFMIFSFFLAVLTLCSVGQGEAWARFTLHPGLYLQVEYNDNLFLTNDDEVGDMSTIIAPNISFLLETKQLLTDLNYGLVFRKYLDETDLDEDKFEDIHRGHVTGTILPESRFNLVYEGTIDRVAVNDRGPDVEENNVVNITTRYYGLARPRYLYRLTPKVTGELAYQYSTTRYDNTTSDNTINSGVDDIVDQDIILLMEMDYSEKLKLQFDTSYNWHDSDKFDDYEVWSGLAGFVWEPQMHVSLDAKMGVDITDTDGNGDKQTDSIFNAILKYRPPEKWGYSVSGKKEFRNSVDDGRYEWWEGIGSITYEGRLSGKLNVFRREYKFQDNNREDKATGVEALVNYELNSRMYFDLFAYYSHRTYKPFTEKSDRYRAGCSLTRKFQNSSLTLRYVFNENNSDIEINDYLNNIVSLDYKVEF